VTDLRPQVYVNVKGGIAEATVTRGDVEIIQVDWDMFEDSEPEAEDILNVYRELKLVADASYRRDLLDGLKEEVSRLTSWRRERRAADKRREQNQLREARELLIAAGELPA
jgi:hypothetical protein